MRLVRTNLGSLKPFMKIDLINRHNRFHLGRIRAYVLCKDKQTIHHEEEYSLGNTNYTATRLIPTYRYSGQHASEASRAFTFCFSRLGSQPYNRTGASRGMADQHTIPNDLLWAAV